MEVKSQKKVVVTGGSGFIGGHVVSELVRRGFDVLVIDKEVDPKSIFALEKLAKKVTFTKLDIRKKEAVLKSIKSFKPSYIYHIAAEPIVESSYEDPYSTFETNIMGTIHILEAARVTKSVKGIIVASSDKAYGKTTKTYTEDSPLRGDHPYDVSKSSADLISQAYYKTYSLPVVITRFGNVYGEGDLHLNRIIPGICCAVAQKKPLLIRSDGTYIRDYIYVKDVADGYITLLNYIDTIQGEAFNFASNETLSVLDLIEKAKEILQTDITYKILNTVNNEIPYQHLNDAKIKKLGWKNNYSLQKTLPQILKWYMMVLKKYG